MCSGSMHLRLKLFSNMISQVSHAFLSVSNPFLSKVDQRSAIKYRKKCQFTEFFNNVIYPHKNHTTFKLNKIPKSIPMKLTIFKCGYKCYLFIFIITSMTKIDILRINSRNSLTDQII